MRGDKSGGNPAQQTSSQQRRCGQQCPLLGGAAIGRRDDCCEVADYCTSSAAASTGRGSRPRSGRGHLCAACRNSCKARERRARLGYERTDPPGPRHSESAGGFIRRMRRAVTPADRPTAAPTVRTRPRRSEVRRTRRGRSELRRLGNRIDEVAARCRSRPSCRPRARSQPRARVE